jgi:hypothetical protein
MLRNGIITLLLLTQIVCAAQQKEKYIGFYSSVVNGGALMQSTASAVSISEIKSLRFGLSYSTQLGPNLFFMTGTEYANHRLSASYSNSPASPADQGVLDLLSFPITLHASWKYLYFTCGLIADFELKNVLYNQGIEKDAMPNQTGLGPLIEFGFKYKYKRFIVYTGTASAVHCIIPFSNQKSKKYYNEADIRLGIRYQLQ